MNDINKSSNIYLEFIRNGYVFCSVNSTHVYEKVSNAYYIDNKTFGQDIINQFHTIEIDRRKGQQKVNRIFGVKPLDKLDFHLIEIPNYHHLNFTFQNEINELKPYIYAFRLAKDKSEEELKLIKNSKINLCENINAEYIHNGNQQKFQLNPYEFIYIENKYEIYLLIDSFKNYTTFNDLQSDYKFSDVIAEIYSSILKVDTHRSSFRELFRETKNNRNYILETELDDISHEKLKKAKQKLEIVDDPKIQFWFSILSALKKKYEYKKYKDCELEDFIFNCIDLNIKDYPLNYDDINDFSNFPLLIILFRSLEIDIDDFNTNSTIAIDIKPYILEKVQHLKNDNLKKFEISLYNSLNNKEVQLKRTFIEQQIIFEKFNQFLVENTFKVDVNLLFLETITNVFNIDLSKTLDVFDIHNIFKNNVRKLETQIESVNKTVLNEILENDINLRSLVYFGEFESIIIEYQEVISNSHGSEEISFNNKKHKTNKGDFEELYNLILSNNPITKIENINTSKPEVVIGEGENRKTKGSPKIPEISDKETLGCIGEIIVFETLKNLYGDENVIWDSGFAKKTNINPKGDDSKHYDIKYKNKNDKWNFIEVKTTTSKKLEFKISNQEVNFGIENKNNYEIMIVINALDEKKKRRIKKLSNPFKFSKDETFTNNSKFLVKNENFTIKLNEI